MSLVSLTPGTKVDVRVLAAAVAAADPRTLAEFLEALGLQVSLCGSQQALGRALRDQAMDLREELSDITTVRVPRAS